MLKSRTTSAAIRLAAAVLFALTVSATQPAHAEADASFPATASVEGTTVKRIGSGLREFMFMDIYTMGAYSQSGTCSATALTSKDEVRYLKLVMKRELPKNRMTSNMRGSLEKNLPRDASEELKGKVETFLSYIKSDLPEGGVVEIAYRPNVGTTLKLNGKSLGPAVPGKDFADTLWRSYFGPKTCCNSLKEQILEPCGG